MYVQYFRRRFFLTHAGDAMTRGDDDMDGLDKVALRSAPKANGALENRSNEEVYQSILQKCANIDATYMVPSNEASTE